MVAGEFQNPSLYQNSDYLSKSIRINFIRAQESKRKFAAAMQMLRQEIT